MTAPGPLNELEYLVLAMVGDGTRSGYAMRKSLNRMRGGRWSTESGSIYRVLRRLEGEGLLVVAGKAGVPKRERTEYELTETGVQVLDDWLRYPPDQSEFALLVDPLRTRGYFLHRISPEERVAAVERWISASDRFLREMMAEMGNVQGYVQDPIVGKSFENLRYLAEARHRWLEDFVVVVREASPQRESESTR